MKPVPLTSSEVDARMPALPEWTRGEKLIARTYTFASFPDAMAFMQRAAFSAEALDHHPEWKNIYDRVWVELTSHDAGGVTERDFSMAALLDAHYARFAPGTPKAE